MKAKKGTKLASASRHRNWQMIIYPESCAENWKEYLIESQVSWIASPLHDKDLNEDGTVKKSHRHIIVVYEGKKNYKDILEDIAQPIGAVFPDLDHEVVVKDLRTAIKYLTHNGFDEKAQYSEIDICKAPSFDIERFTQISENEQDQIIFDIIDHIEQQDTKEIRDLILYARYNNHDWFRVIKHKTIFFNHYITSKRNKEKEKADEEDSYTD